MAKRTETELVVRTPDMEMLMDPAQVVGLISRTEVVNLLVVEYLDVVRKKLAPAQADVTRMRADCGAAWKTAYALWFDQIQATVMPRLEPWHRAVANALGTEVSTLISEALPRPDQ